MQVFAAEYRAFVKRAPFLDRTISRNVHTTFCFLNFRTLNIIPTNPAIRGDGCGGGGGSVKQNKTARDRDRRTKGKRPDYQTDNHRVAGKQKKRDALTNNRAISVLMQKQRHDALTPTEQAVRICANKGAPP